MSEKSENQLPSEAASRSSDGLGDCWALIDVTESGVFGAWETPDEAMTCLESFKDRIFVKTSPYYGMHVKYLPHGYGQDFERA